MAIDPFLYIALAAGVVAGRMVHWRGPWLDRATLATVAALVFFLGVEFGATSNAGALQAIPVSFGLVALLFATTLVTLWTLPYKALKTPRTVTAPDPPIPFGIVLIAALFAGLAIGRSFDIRSTTPLTASLYLLLALVGFDLRFSRRSLSNLWAPLTASVVGAVVTAFVWVEWTGIPVSVALATTFAFGFYSLAGPLVTAQAGVTLGIVAFLTNFLRENLTMIASPSLGPTVRAEGLAAMGGATAMDTTLYFVVRYGDPEGAGLALATGLTLTLVASLLLPVFLSI